MKKTKVCMAIGISALLGGVAFGLAACKNGGDSSQSAAPEQTLSFALETVVLEQGDLYAPEVLAANGALTYTSDNENVVAIAEGKLLAKAEGQANVTVSDGKYSDTLIVTVNADNIPVLSFVAQTPAVYVGGEYLLPVELSYKGETVTEEIEYEFTLLGEGAAEIAVLSENGGITGVKEGSVTVEVTANYRYFTLSDTCEVTVLEHSNLALNQGNVRLVTKALHEGEKESLPLYAMVTEKGERVENANITWKITNENVVALSDGVLSAIGAGNATIRATYQTQSGKEVYAECFVSVEKPLIQTGAKATYYRNKEKFVLPEIDNLATGEGLLVDRDITQIYSKDGVHSGVTPLQIVDSTLNDALWNGAETVWTVCTQQVDYLVAVEVHTALIATAQELMDVHKFIYEDIPNAQVLGDIRLEKDIDMTGQDWLPAYNIGKSAVFSGGEQKFNGVFDGCGYSIMGFTVGNSEALIAQLGVNGVVKNLKIQSGCVDYNGRTGLLARLIYGGRFENIEITAKHTYGGKSVSEAPGIVFGQLFSYATSTYGTTYLENVKITATDANVAAHAYASVLGCTGNTGAVWDNTAAADEENNSLIVLRNVEMNGFQNIFAYNGAVITTQAEMESRFNCTALTVTEKTYAQIIAEKTTKLPARELELDAAKEYTVTVDFTALVSGEIAKISVDGATMVGTSKVFGKLDASNVAKTCLIEMASGKLYAVQITIWSQLIDTPDDLLVSNAYGYLASGAFYGYFKLTDNIDMSKASSAWAQTNRIDNGSTKNSNSGGFQGVFEGNGKTISNFKVANSETALFYAMGQNGVIRNVTFDKATNSSLSSSAILVACVSGGLIENVTIHMTKMPQGYAVDNCGAIIFGRMNGYGAVTTLKNVAITCATENTAYGTANGGTYEFATVIGQYTTATANKILVDGLTITGIVDTNIIATASTKVTIGVSTTKTYTTGGDAKTCVVKQESVLLSYLTLGEGGLKINGKNVTE